MRQKVRPAVESESRALRDGYRLLGDQPHTRPDDALGFDEIARKLRELILLSGDSTPFTIGIEASWGRGKSSLMRRLAYELDPEGNPLEAPAASIRPSAFARLAAWLRAAAAQTRAWLGRRLARLRGRPVETEEPELIRTIWFNAWTAEGGGNALEGLIKSVLQAMDPNALRRALRHRQLMGGVRIVLLFVAGWLRVGALVDAAWDRLSADSRTRNETQALVEETMREWLAQVGAAGRQARIVVFIDDLDRCSPDNVLRVFEAIKVYLDAPGFVFVVGYDEGILSDGIRSEKQFTEAVTGRDYIEKIVQIVFRIPHPGPEVGRLVDGYLEESRTGELFHEPEIHLITERNSRNPRRIKRFINRFVLEHRLDKGAKGVEPPVLVASLMFETYFSKFARLFSEPERRPISEFQEYREVRTFLRQGNLGVENEKQLFNDVFGRYGLQAPGAGDNPQDMLARLEQEGEGLPEFFPELVQNSDFVALVEGAKPLEGEIARLAQRRPDRLVHAAAEAPPVPGDLTGLRILWVDDNPANNETLMRLLRDRGAEVTAVETGAEAEDAVKAGRVDVLISDIGRGDRPKAGFDDLKKLQKEAGYTGPAVFYASYVSVPRRNSAKDLGASITAVPEELLRIVADIAGRAGSAEPAVKRAAPA